MTKHTWTAPHDLWFRHGPQTPDDAAAEHGGILRIAQDLHSAHCGVSDPLPDELEARMLMWLAWRVREGWRPSKPQSAFDDAVRSVAEAALHERGYAYVLLASVKGYRWLHRDGVRIL